MFTYGLIGGLWLIWLAGLLTQSFVRSLAVSLFNFVGAAALWVIARRSPPIIRRTLLGLASGLAFLGIGDVIFSLSQINGAPTEAIREVFYLIGVVLFLVFGSLLPFAMERQGLYPERFALRTFAIALAGGVVLVGLSSLFRPLPLVQMVYLGTSFYLTLLFAQQVLVLAGGRIGQSLREVVFALVLGSLARVVTVLAGPGLPMWSIITYDLLWISAMSVLLIGAMRR